MDLGLAGKVVIVTGAGRGIGRVIARSFAAEGSNVVVADIDEGNASRVAAEIAAAGGKAEARRVDVVDDGQVRTMVEGVVGRHGRVDVLVNDAGINSKTPTQELTLERWRQTLDVNLTGMFNCCRAVMGPMSERRSGRIVSLASINAFRIEGLSDAGYIASKAGIAGLTRKLANDLAPYGVTCNAVAPSVTNTEMGQETFRRVGIETMVAKVPLRRICEPEDVANAVLFLGSDAAAFITGQVLHVNGGSYM